MKRGGQKSDFRTTMNLFCYLSCRWSKLVMWSSTCHWRSLIQESDLSVQVSQAMDGSTIDVSDGSGQHCPQRAQRGHRWLVLTCHPWELWCQNFFSVLIMPFFVTYITLSYFGLRIWLIWPYNVDSFRIRTLWDLITKAPTLTESKILSHFRDISVTISVTSQKSYVPCVPY